jgi:hypothetical protein
MLGSLLVPLDQKVGKVEVIHLLQDHEVGEVGEVRGSIHVYANTPFTPCE